MNTVNNSKAFPAAVRLGYAKNVTGSVDKSLRGLVRLHADAAATVKLKNSGGDGMNLGAGETIYLVLPEDEDIEVTGTVNLMLVE